MIIDLIEKPKTFWWEDEHGNEILPSDPSTPAQVEINKQFSVQCCVRVNKYHPLQEDKWPVKILKWIIRKLPKSWSQNYYSYEQTVSDYFNLDLVVKLVNEKRFLLNDAIIVASEMCERCVAACLTDTIDSSRDSDYNCKYCKIIDPEYYNWRRARNCYTTFKFGGDVAKSFSSGDADYASMLLVTQQKLFRKLWNWVRY